MTPDEQHLQVATMYGGVSSGCTRWEGWEVEETDERVEVKALVWRKRFPDGCTDEGITQSTEIALSAPLGDRDLVGCGRNDCRTSDANFLGWQEAPDIALVDGGVVLAGASSTYTVTAQGPVRWSGAGWLSDLVAVAGNRLVAFGGSATVGFDVSSGAEAWRVEGFPVAADDYAAYVCRDDLLAAVDVETGAAQWTVNLPCGEFMIPTGDIATLIGGDRDVDGGYELIRIDLPSGDVIERRPFDDGVDDQVTGFEGAVAVGDRIIVTGGQADLVVLGIHGDELVRQSNGIGRPIGSAAGLAIIVSGARVAAVDPISGEVMWSSTEHTRGSVAVSGNALWVLDKDGGTVSRLDAESGIAMWTAPVGTTSGFAVAADESIAYVATSLAVVALDASTGDLLWWHHIPSEQS